jgi:hypothetical protein
MLNDHASAFNWRTKVSPFSNGKSMTCRSGRCFNYVI